MSALERAKGLLADAERERCDAEIPVSGMVKCGQLQTDGTLLLGNGTALEGVTVSNTGVPIDRCVEVIGGNSLLIDSPARIRRTRPIRRETLKSPVYVLYRVDLPEASEVWLVGQKSKTLIGVYPLNVPIPFRSAQVAQYESSTGDLVSGQIADVGGEGSTGSMAIQGLAGTWSGSFTLPERDPPTSTISATWVYTIESTTDIRDGGSTNQVLPPGEYSISASVVGALNEDLEINTALSGPGGFTIVGGDFINNPPSIPASQSQSFSLGIESRGRFQFSGRLGGALYNNSESRFALDSGTHSGNGSLTVSEFAFRPDGYLSGNETRQFVSVYWISEAGIVSLDYINGGAKNTHTAQADIVADPLDWRADYASIYAPPSVLSVDRGQNRPDTAGAAAEIADIDLNEDIEGTPLQNLLIQSDGLIEATVTIVGQDSSVLVPGLAGASKVLAVSYVAPTI